MNICVCGWHYYEPFYSMLNTIKNEHSIFVIQNRRAPWIIEDIGWWPRENVGLEWGAYDRYLMQWYVKGPTLYCHDDSYLENAEEVLEALENEGSDHAYIFNSEKEEIKNKGRFIRGNHGRAFVLSHDFQMFLKNHICRCEIDGHRYEHNGFWFDPTNDGHIWKTDSLWPENIRHHFNAGIVHFMWTLERFEKVFNVNNVLYIPEWHNGYRGKISNKEELCKKYHFTDAVYAVQ